MNKRKSTCVDNGVSLERVSEESCLMFQVKYFCLNCQVTYTNSCASRSWERGAGIE